MNTKTSVSSKNYWWVSLFSGLMLLLFGIWFLLAPLESFKSLTIVFGIILILTGLTELYFLIKSKTKMPDLLSYLWGGLLNVILGIILLLNPMTLLVIMSLLIGFWLIFKGGEQIKRAMQLRKNNNTVWKRVLTLGITMIVAAAILLWHPEIIGFTIALWTSVAFIMIGIFRIYLAIRLR